MKRQKFLLEYISTHEDQALILKKFPSLSEFYTDQNPEPTVIFDEDFKCFYICYEFDMTNITMENIEKLEEAAWIEFDGCCSITLSIGDELGEGKCHCMMAKYCKKSTKLPRSLELF